MKGLMVSKKDVGWILTDYVRSSPGNIISRDMAYDGKDVGIRIFEAPILAVGSAEDPLWERMKGNDAVGRLFRTPKEWVPGAKSVIAFFAPFSQAVVDSNRSDDGQVGSAWMSAYRYGEGFLKDGSHLLELFFRAHGYEAFEPYASDSFQCVYTAGSDPAIDPDLAFTSNWSVRHAAYICGLGTFSLSRGLITRKGMAGRIGTVITTAELPVDARDYTETEAYCVHCGNCARRCPAQAISVEHGKDHAKCLAFLEQVAERYPLCDCCGKCQVNVPCERNAPGRKVPQKA